MMWIFNIHYHNFDNVLIHFAKNGDIAINNALSDADHYCILIN